MSVGKVDDKYDFEELTKIADDMGLDDYQMLDKQALIRYINIFQTTSDDEEPVTKNMTYDEIRGKFGYPLESEGSEPESS